jgi:hypothetical protein
MFNRKKKLKIEEAVRKHVQSFLPSGIHAFNPIGDSDIKEVIISGRPVSLSFELAFENEEVEELTEDEKDMITRQIVIPALEGIDRTLFDRHKLIETKLKKLKAAYD